MSLEQDIKDLERLQHVNSWRGPDLVTMKNLYVTYMDNKATICLSCPSNLRMYLRNFKSRIPNVLIKLKAQSHGK